MEEGRIIVNPAQPPVPNVNPNPNPNPNPIPNSNPNPNSNSILNRVFNPTPKPQTHVGIFPLFFVLVAFIIAMVFIVSAMFRPWFLSDFSNHQIQYYFDYAKYDIGDKKFYYSQCKDEKYSSLWCDQLVSVSDMILSLVIITFIFLSGSSVYLFGRIIYRIIYLPQIMPYQTILNEMNILMLIALISYLILFALPIAFFEHWPYTKLCYEDCSLGIFDIFNEGCSCSWGSAVQWISGANYFLIGAICSLLYLSLLYAQIRGQAQYNQLLIDSDMSVNPYDNKQNCIQCLRCCGFGCLSISLCITWIIAHFIIQSFQVTFVNPARHSLSYIQGQWEDAVCLNDSSYYYTYPLITEYGGSSCSFEFPGNDTFYYDCCKTQTCSSAFHYKSLFIELESNCEDEMNWIQKASCHPLNKNFVGSDFNISQSPVEKMEKNITITYDNSVALCYLYCYQVYNSCATSILSIHPTMNVGEYYQGDVDTFCHDALGSALRYEIFTDHCYSRSSFLEVQHIFVFVFVLFFTLQ